VDPVLLSARSKPTNQNQIQNQILFLSAKAQREKRAGKFEKKRFKSMSQDSHEGSTLRDDPLDDDPPESQQEQQCLQNKKRPRGRPYLLSPCMGRSQRNDTFVCTVQVALASEFAPLDP
jgi:hypothetical protein